MKSLKTEQIAFCSVLEFTAEPDFAYLPYWVFTLFVLAAYFQQVNVSSGY